MATCYVSNCGHDENGAYTGGVAGDQTGTEWHIIPWYYYGQSAILRYPSKEVRQLQAELSREAAANNKIGYDQSQRVTFWNELEKVGYRPRNIKTVCEADCSAGVCAIAKACGYLLNITALKELPITSTYYMRNVFKSSGYQVLTDARYTQSGNNLYTGDIILRDNMHTCIVSAGIDTTDSSTKLDVDGWLGYLSISEFQKQLSTYIDGYISGQYIGNKKYLPNITSIDYTDTGSTMVYALQRKIGASIDGYIGHETVSKLQEYLNKNAKSNLSVDGVLGPATAKAIQSALNANMFLRSS